MTRVPLGVGAYNRSYGQEPNVELLNRFFEQTPTNQVEGSVLLSRPGTTIKKALGSSNPRKLFTQPGAFGGDLFAVVGETLYRWDGENAPIAIAGTVGDIKTPSMTVQSGIGYEHLFIADGTNLQYYEGLSYASGTLTVTPSSPPDVANGDTLEIGGVYYQWTSGSVDTGTPAGTSGNPWLVALGSSDTVSLSNMREAIQATGDPGTTYSSALTAHPTVTGVSSSATELVVRARTSGTGGNSITTTETGANIGWGAGTLEGGGTHVLKGVDTPDDVAIVCVATLASFVFALVSNSQRFYYIRPGEVTIDPLDFAEAESEPDELIEAVRVNDVMWLFGASSSEPWYPTGQTGLGESPFAPAQGRTVSQGILEGTAAVVRNTPIVVAEDGVVYAIGGGEPQRLSTNAIEERIRIARREEAQNG